MIQSFGLCSIEVRRMLDACFSPRLSFEWVWPSEKVHGAGPRGFFLWWLTAPPPVSQVETLLPN